MKANRLIWLIPLISIFLLVRFQNLTQLPVFGDEAIYIRWSQLIKNVETLRFVPVSDGKQPLFMWFVAIGLKFISDPLVAGRSITILAGLGTLITIYFFSISFFSQKAAIISGLIYIFLPFTFFFDRLATADSLLAFWGILSLYLALLLAKYPRLDISIILGFVLGLSWLTKSPAVYFITLSLLTFFIFSFQNYKKYYFPVLSATIAFLIYNILRLGPQFSQIAIRNQDYVWKVSDILKHPFDPLFPHINDVIHLYSFFISLPVLLLFIVFVLLNKKYFNRLLLIVFIWWILPLLATLIFAKVFTARYILFSLPPLILLIGYSFSLIKSKLLFFPILAFIPNLFLLSQLSTNPFSLNLPSTETGYVQDWTSGWGIKTSAEYLKKRSLETNVIVGTEGYFGTLPDGLQIYTDGIPRLTIFGVGLNLTHIPDKLIEAKRAGDEVYLLINQNRHPLSQNIPSDSPVVIKTPKPDGDHLLLIRL